VGKQWIWKDSPYQKLDHNIVEQLRGELYLCDGGLYDNMGIEMLWKHGSNKEYEVVFSCDAGAPFDIPLPQHGVLGWMKKKVGWRKLWTSQFMRMSDVMIDQQRSLRKRSLVRNFITKEYTGAYWAIENRVQDDKVFSPLITKEQSHTYNHLKGLKTCLRPFNDGDAEKLVNWGYCHADMSLRSWYESTISVGTLPY